MKDSSERFPRFDERFPDLNEFLLKLVDQYNARQLESWDALDTRVRAFFTPQKMDEMEARVPHWCKMASYAEGLTLTHVICVFIGLYMMPEFLRMSDRQQQIMKWVILFHDVEKEIPDGKRDHAHAFRSAVGAGRTLPTLGFPVAEKYHLMIDDWDRFTRSALTMRQGSSEIVQDNRKLPQILDGIDNMFGANTPAASIIKTVLFHLSIHMNFWPPPTPLTNEEVRKYFDHELAALQLVMNLADNEGWNLFHPDTRAEARLDTLQVFEEITNLLS